MRQLNVVQLNWRCNSFVRVELYRELTTIARQVSVQRICAQLIFFSLYTTLISRSVCKCSLFAIACANLAVVANSIQSLSKSGYVNRGLGADSGRMPIPTDVGALARAHRVVCVRCVRAMQANDEHACEFDVSSSKKCKYCTMQKATCVAVGCQASVDSIAN